MKHIEITALVLWVFAQGTTVHAGDAKFSLLRCGMTWAGSATESKTYTAKKKEQKYDTQRALAFLPSPHPDNKTFNFKTSNRPEQGLLPTTYTIAKIGCSWR
jgi:hypothetical protein